MRNHFFLAFLLVLLSTQNIFGQQTTDGESQRKSAVALLDKGDYAGADKECRAAIAAFVANGELGNWLLTKRVEADIAYAADNSPFRPIDILKDALSKLPRQPKSQQDYFFLCKLLHGKSWFEKKAEDYVALKGDLEWAYQIFKTNLGGKDAEIAEYLLLQLGNGYVRLGEYHGAKRMFEEGIEIGATYPQVAKFNDYGSLYLTLENYPAAIRIFRQGLNFKGLPEIELPLLYLNESETLARLDSFEQALASNKKAAVLIGKLGKSHRRYTRYKSGLFENYAIINAGIARSGNRTSFVKAIEWYDKTLALITAPGEQAANRDIAGFQISKADLQSEWGKPQEALKTYHLAIQTLIPTVGGKYSDNPSLTSLTAEKMLYRALEGKARAFRALHQLENALACYELIPIVEAKLRATHAYESSSLLALYESRKRFQEAIDIAWQLYERSNGNPQFAERAFRLTELARGMLLLQSLIQARQYLPEDIRNKDYELRVRMAWLEHEIAAEREKEAPSYAPARQGLAGGKASAGKNPDSKKISDWERQLFDLKLDRQKLLADFPSYNNPDSLFLQVLAAKDVRSLLRPGQAMADFFLTETAAYIFSFDANGDFRWRKAALPQQFREQTKAFVSYLWAGEDAGREQFLRHAWLLDSLLLAPERERWGKAIGSLVIVPDDVLMLVPFEVLLSRPSSGGTWRDQPWLLADYNFGYAYSATLLNVQKSISEEHAKATEKPIYTFGGFAPTYSTSGEYKLQNTRPMVKNVRNLLGGRDWCGKDASEERFKNTAANYRSLLLAMHGISDSEHPELSRLLFGDPGPDSVINNNILYASELQIMRLQADLVVLSACHSGSGKIEHGEGVYSLARAFAAARVPATVMSLWLLHEETAPKLVEAFFKYLQQGKTKDEALRQAKLEFLKNDANFETTHPFFWAGLAALGDMRALDLPAKPPFEGQWWWILGLAALAGAGLWWRWQKKPLHSQNCG